MVSERHRAILVTAPGNTDAHRAWSKAIEIFQTKDRVFDISPIVSSQSGNYHSFLIPPDGCGLSYVFSREAVLKRQAYIAWLRDHQKQYSWRAFHWAEVYYGDNEGNAKVVNSSCNPEHQSEDEFGELLVKPVVKFINNPIQDVIDIYTRLYNKPVEIGFTSDIGKKNNAPYGMCVFPADGSTPQVVLDANLEYIHLVEVLAHELAHVVTGEGCECDGHTPEWDAVFTKINEEYIKLNGSDGEVEVSR